MRKINLLAIGFILLFGACSPKITTQLSKSYAPLDYKEDVKVLGLNDPVPGKSEELGIVKIGDNGFTTNCGYDAVIDAAKLVARKAGGNAIKIIDHIPPSLFGSSCHRITAKILKVLDFGELHVMSKADSVLANADYALLHIYRFSGAGALIGFDLHLGDTVICRVKNNWRKTLRIKKDGLNTIWARTEVKEELPVNLKIGKEYYIRCSITMGAFVGHPKLELVNNETGKVEYESIKLDKSEVTDKIILKDGRDFDCRIQSEDDENVYFSIFKNDKEIKTQMSKKEIKEIQKGE
jgi:hypothetical protein